MSWTILLKWIAHALALASTAMLLFFMFGGSESLRPNLRELMLMLFFPVGVILGFALAWWREGLGGGVTVTSLIIFYLMMFVFSGRINLGPYFLLFSLPGFLHLANAIWLSKMQRPSLN